MKDEDVPLSVVQAGARVILDAAPPLWPALAKASGIEILPDDADLIAAMARSNGATPEYFRRYLQALADGSTVAAAHEIAVAAWLAGRVAARKLNEAPSSDRLQ